MPRVGTAAPVSQEALTRLEDRVRELESQELSASESSQRIAEFAAALFAELPTPSDPRSGIPDLAERLLELDEAQLSIKDQRTLWDTALAAAKRGGEAEVVHELLMLRFASSRGSARLTRDISELGAVLDEFPEATSKRLVLRYIEAWSLIQEDPARSFECLGIVEQAIAQLDEAQRPAWQLPRDLCYAALQMAQGRANMAFEPLYKYVGPKLERGELLEYRLLKPWVEYLMQVNQHAGAIELISQHLADEEAFPLGSSPRNQLLARRGVARAEAALVGSSDGALARSDLREALGGPGLSRVARDLAWLSLVEIDWVTRDEASFLQELEQAEGELGERSSTLSQARLECLRVHRDSLLGADRSTLLERQRTLEGLWSRKLEDWRAAPPEPLGIGFVHSGDRRDVLAVLIELALELDPGGAGLERALGYVVDLQMIGELVRHSGLRTPTVKDLMARFSEPGCGALVLVQARMNTHLFALDASGVIHATSDSGRLRSLSQAWDRALRIDWEQLAGTTSDSEAVRAEREAARELSAALFPQVIASRLARCTSLTISGTQTFMKSGVAWLPLGDDDYLGLEREVCEWPSLPAGVLLEERSRRAEARPEHEPRLLLAGGAVHSDAARARWPALIEIPLPKELEELARSSGSFDEVDVLRGEALTRDQLLKKLLAGPDIALFFLHAVSAYDLDEERPTALALSSDGGSPSGLFLARDLAELWPNEAGTSAPRFVILAACKSGAGRNRLGSGMGTDLGSAFLLAGSEAVLSSRRDLPLGPARIFVDALMEALGSGHSPAAATRLARHSIFEELGSRSPFVLHGLRLIGAVERPLWKERPPQPLKGWGGRLALGLVFAALVVHSWRRR